MEEEERNEGFKVTDKRRFTQEGQSKPSDQPSSDSHETQGEPSEGEQPAERTESRTQSGAESKELPPPMDFTTFVISMANTALFQLGLVRGPESDEPKKDLAGARQTIDLLALIEEKTRGNLTDQEKKILTEALYQLRMVFVEASK